MQKRIGLVFLLAGLGIVGITSSAQALTLQPAPSFMTRWVRESRAPLPDAVVHVEQSAFCQGANVYGGCREAAGNGTTEGPYHLYARTRDAFYFEIGGIFDSAMLTNADRRYLARKWGLPHWHWWDTRAGVEYGDKIGQPVEDGLEAVFGLMYQECAWGHSTKWTGFALDGPPGVRLPTVVDTGPFDTCAWLRHR